jgi:hypothetical protein
MVGLHHRDARCLARTFDPSLRSQRTTTGSGIALAFPSSVCGHLFGFLRADALAGIRVGDRTVTLFTERDLGTERGEVLDEKVRRYRSLFARPPDVPIAVGIVVEAARRASTIHSLSNRYATAGLSFLTISSSTCRLSAGCPPAEVSEEQRGCWRRRSWPPRGRGS